MGHVLQPRVTAASPRPVNKPPCSAPLPGAAHCGQTGGDVGVSPPWSPAVPWWGHAHPPAVVGSWRVLGLLALLQACVNRTGFPQPLRAPSLPTGCLQDLTQAGTLIQVALPPPVLLQEEVTPDGALSLSQEQSRAKPWGAQGGALPAALGTLFPCRGAGAGAACPTLAAPSPGAGGGQPGGLQGSDRGTGPRSFLPSKDTARPPQLHAPPHGHSSCFPPPQNYTCLLQSIYL